MISTNIQDACCYKSLSPAMKKAIEYIQSGSWKYLPTDKQRYPVHAGEVTTTLFASSASLKKEGVYFEDKDFQGYTSDGKAVQVIYATPGQLFFFFPEDGHQPNLKLGSKGQVDKVVIKVVVE